MNRASITYLSSSLLLGLVTGCAPHPYERLALVLPNEEGTLRIIETGKLQDCIFKENIPIGYRLEKGGYEIEIASISGFNGHMPRLYFHATNNAGVPLAVSGEGVAPASNQPWQYENFGYQWVASSKSAKRLKLAIIGSNKIEVGEEDLLVTVKSCKAVEIDAL